MHEHEPYYDHNQDHGHDPHLLVMTMTYDVDHDTKTMTWKPWPVYHDQETKIRILWQGNHDQDTKTRKPWPGYHDQNTLTIACLKSNLNTNLTKINKNKTCELIIVDLCLVTDKLCIKDTVFTENFNLNKGWINTSKPWTNCVSWILN